MHSYVDAFHTRKTLAMPQSVPGSATTSEAMHWRPVVQAQEGVTRQKNILKMSYVSGCCGERILAIPHHHVVSVTAGPTGQSPMCYTPYQK